jgi:hypothetical protein
MSLIKEIEIKELLKKISIATDFRSRREYFCRH